MEDKNRIRRALLILTMGNKYLYLVKNILEENIKSGQSSAIIYNDAQTDEKMNEDTKWFFRIIIIPMLFNFYHGIELTMKGFLIALPSYDLNVTHCLSKLLEAFKENYQDQNKIIEIIEKYVTVSSMPPYLKNWFLKYNLDIDRYYEFLKYPLDKKFEEEYDYFNLKYDLDEKNRGIDFSNSMLYDISLLLPQTVSLYRAKLEPFT